MPERTTIQGETSQDVIITDATLEWLNQGKVIDTRAVDPVPGGLQIFQRMPIFGTLFKIPDQQFVLAKEGNYYIRINGHFVNLQNGHSGIGIPFVGIDSVITEDLCSAPRQSNPKRLRMPVAPKQK